MKNAKNIKLAAAAVKSAVKSKVSTIKNVRVSKVKIPNFFIKISTLLSLFNYTYLIKNFNKFLKKLLGPYYATIIPFIFGMVFIFRKSAKVFLIINLIIALYIYINHLLNIPIDLSYDLMVYIIYSMYINITDYIYYIIHKTLVYIKNIFTNIGEYFYNKQKSIDYIRHRYDTNPSNERIKLSKSEFYPLYDDPTINSSLKDYYYYDEEDNTYISKKAVYIALVLGVIIIGGMIYFQDPSYYNEAIYSGYKTTRDYISSLFWDRPDKPDKPNFPPLDKGKDKILGYDADIPSSSSKPIELTDFKPRHFPQSTKTNRIWFSTSDPYEQIRKSIFSKGSFTASELTDFNPDYTGLRPQIDTNYTPTNSAYVTPDPTPKASFLLDYFYLNSFSKDFYLCFIFIKKQIAQ